ncbi:MAG: DUF1015 domain-containing protein [Propionibacteriaceae bacterium]
MVDIKPFRSVRPAASLADQVAALPYDTMNSAEARELVKDNPYSFLHVDKSEVDLPEGTDLYSDAVYAKATENLQKMIADGTLVWDQKPCYYIYKLVMGSHEQSGLVACSAIDDYQENAIKKHELTRAAKEEDRIRHVDETDFHTGPIYLAYRDVAELNDIVAQWQDSHDPAADVVADDQIRHTVWVIDDVELLDRITGLFAQIPATYIADGHHRCASAAKVGLRRREAAGVTKGLESDYFLSVLFPAGQLAIMDYNRVVTDLNGLTTDEYLAAVAKAGFTVTAAPAGEPYRPQSKHEFGMLLDDVWYVLTATAAIVDENDPIKQLDVSILQENLLHPILGIADPRTDNRIDFIGGIRGLGELEKRCHEDMKVAFSMFPTSMDDLFAIADAGAIMPPKSTWFEPKMRSGLFLHSLTQA